MSRRPGLGYDFFYEHIDSLLENGYVTLPNGSKAPLPKYYYRLAADEGIDEYLEHQLEIRRAAAAEQDEDPEVTEARYRTMRKRHELEAAKDGFSATLHTDDVQMGRGSYGGGFATIHDWRQER